MPTSHQAKGARLRVAHPHLEAPPGRGLQRLDMPDRQAHPRLCSQAWEPHLWGYHSACVCESACVWTCVRT